MGIWVENRKKTRIYVEKRKKFGFKGGWMDLPLFGLKIPKFGGEILNVVEGDGGFEGFMEEYGDFGGLMEVWG